MKLSDCGIFGFMLALILGILGMAVAMPFSSVELDGEASVAEVDAEPVLVIIENVATRGGLEVFPEPDRASGRIFAAAANFTPHVAGINAEGDWLLILYFDNGALVAGWSPLSQLVLTDEEISTLVVVDPQNLPTLPTEIAGDTTSASRPYGTSAGSNPEPTDTPEAPPSGGGGSSGGGGGGNPSPTSPPPPPTNTPGPIQTEEPTEF